MNKEKDFAIVMAYEAFRLALGIQPRYFTPQEIMRWLKLMQQHKTK